MPSLDDIDIDLGGLEIDPVVAVLIAQLRRNGTLSNTDLDNMKRRLIEGGDADLAQAINGVILSDMIDDPDERRASIHVISERSDGGNGEP